MADTWIRRVVGVTVVAAIAGVSVTAAGGISTGAETIAPPGQQVSRKPQLRGGADGQRAWLLAQHRGLTLLKVVTKADRSVAIELRFREDAVSLAIDGSGTVTVGRAGRAVRLTSPEAIEQLQQLVAGSEAVFATRMLLAERESTSDLQPHEMSVLAVAAFVASLTGDADAPTRLSRRFLEKHLGVFTRVRSETCFEKYSKESTASWNDMQDCVAEADQAESVWERAYRRAACNGVWLIRSEAAWFEFVGCMGLGGIIE
jgi:hypothetical protein